MIRLPPTSLSPVAQGQLRRYQSSIDELPVYADRVAEAGRKFKTANSPKNATFRAVRQTLSEMCSGARRCVYCEDSFADEVEHISPKSLYPERAFVWENYVYACGPCNGPKNNRFSVFQAGSRTEINVARKRGEPVVPPQAGEPLLIDPRTENPLDFMELDLLGTFLFLPTAPRGTTAFRRAEYTIDALRLNERDYLIQARGEAYGSYRARLAEYIDRRARGDSRTKLRLRQHAVIKMGHPTVWREMQRQHTLVAELGELFASAPEALEW